MSTTHEIRNVRWGLLTICGGERQCHNLSCRGLEQTLQQDITNYRNQCFNQAFAERHDLDILQASDLPDLFEHVRQQEALRVSTLSKWSITDSGAIGRHTARTNEMLEHHDIAFEAIRRLPDDQRRALIIVAALEVTPTCEDLSASTKKSASKHFVQLNDGPAIDQLPLRKRLVECACALLDISRATLYRRADEGREGFGRYLQDF